MVKRNATYHTTDVGRIITVTSRDRRGRKYEYRFSNKAHGLLTVDNQDNRDEIHVLIPGLGGTLPFDQESLKFLFNIPFNKKRCIRDVVIAPGFLPSGKIDKEEETLETHAELIISEMISKKKNKIILEGDSYGNAYAIKLAKKIYDSWTGEKNLDVTLHFHKIDGVNKAKKTLEILPDDIPFKFELEYYWPEPIHTSKAYKDFVKELERFPKDNIKLPKTAPWSVMPISFISRIFQNPDQSDFFTARDEGYKRKVFGRLEQPIIGEFEIDLPDTTNTEEPQHQDSFVNKVRTHDAHMGISI